MNVESANVLSLLPSASIVDGVSPPLVEDGATTEGFSETLLAQIGLLTAVNSESSVPLQVQPEANVRHIDNLQDIAGLPVIEDGQDSAALVGKDLPTMAKINDVDNHSATLEAVTDTLKYIAAGSTAEDKAAETEQNMKNVIALGAETERNMKDVIASTAETGQDMKDIATINVPAQVDASLANANSGLNKEAKNQGQDQIASAEDSSLKEEPVAAIVLPPVILTEQTKTDNKVVQADAIKDKVLSTFVKPLTEGVKLNLSLKDQLSSDVSQQDADFYRSTQEKQGLNLKYFENAGQAEKTGQIDRQSLSSEGDKVSSRVAGDIAQLNRPTTDNKADAPVLAKHLSHPEWSKDLGDRIVWMNNKAIPTAEIKMNPQHLGPISVRIDVNQDHQANIVFTAQHAVVREALEASIPKLREMMSAQQLNLVDVSISQNSTSGQGQPQSQPQGFAQMADGGRRGKGAEGMLADGISDVMEDVENGQALVSKGILSIYA